MTTEENTADVIDVEATGTETEFEAPSTPEETARRGWFGVLRPRLVLIVLTVVLIAATAVTAWLFFTQFRPNLETDEAAANAAKMAASEGTVALLSYAPESLEQDFAAAKTHLTGDFLSYYNRFTQEIVLPAAREKNVETSAEVVKAAVSELRPDDAIVLLFVNQATKSAQVPGGSFTASAVRVSLTKVDGAWLISSFEPV